EAADGGGRSLARRDQVAVAAELHRSEAQLPRQDGGERRDAAAELLHEGRQRRSGSRPEPPGLEVQGSISMRKLRLAAAGLALTLLTLPTAAAAAVQLGRVDASA